MYSKPKFKMLAVASFGGHWVQLSRLSCLFQRFEVDFCCTEKNISIPSGRLFYIKDASLSTWYLIPVLLIQAVKILFMSRPKVIVSTGALPGLVVLFVGKYIFRCKTVWIDSIANGDQMSASGRMASRFTDVCLTQWEDLATKNVDYMGSVI